MLDSHSMTIHELLLRRFATKKFDPTKKVSDEDLAYVLEAAHLSCSSLNVQPWQITVITNPELRAKLREASYGQPQVTDASHLLVLSGVKDPMGRINTTAALIEASAGAEGAEAYKKMAMGSLPTGDDAKLQAWLRPQAYLALQAMILAAADRGLDSCPMEGFNPVQYSEILGFTDRVPYALLPLGYALEPGFKKIRVPLEDIVDYRA